MTRLARQIVMFCVVGGVQLAVDTGLFLVLFALTGSSSGSNIVSRGSAALLGYALNSAITFRSETADRPLRSGATVLRYFLLWLVMTAASTALVDYATQQLTDAKGQFGPLAAAKLGIEIVLAGASFLSMRLWVFRRASHPQAAVRCQ